MKKLRFVIAISLTVLLASCAGNDPDNHGVSTPIDSVTLNGTAPVEYGPKDPNEANRPLDPDTRDTGMKANTMNHDDSVREGLKTK